MNTLGEVPDSAWYTNRHSCGRMSIADSSAGRAIRTPPEPDGAWRIVGAKSDGMTPGFVIEDEHKNRYVLKFDPPRFPGIVLGART